MTRHFLYLTNSRVVSVATQGRRIAMRREFATSAGGLVELERHVAGLEPMTTNVFTDLSEEDFRPDQVPHVGARDREAIFGRRLTQVFRNTPFRYAVLQGREAEGRRDDRVMYTAVTNPEVLRPLLDIFERNRTPLAGIHSAAVFSAVLLDELDLAYAHTLLVTFTPGDAMRQTYFRNGEIRFSRLTPLDLQTGQSLGAMVAEETTRTWQYLDSLRHFGPEDRLEVCVLVHPSDREAVAPELRDFAQIKYQILDVEIVATKLGLKPPPLTSSAEEVMVHLFHLRPAPNHFATPEMRRFSSLRRAHQVLVQLSVAILLTCVGWGGYYLAGAYAVNRTDDELRRQVASIAQESERISRDTPSFGVGGSTMRDAVAFYNGSMQGFPTLGDFLRPLSGVLQEHPRVKLTQLAWMATDNEKATPSLGSGGARTAAPVKSIPKAVDPGAAANAPASAPRDEANPPFSGGRYEVALVEATINVKTNDFRGALAEAERLASDMERLPGFRATIVESPLDTGSGISLQGRLADREPEQMETRFVLRIQRDRGVGA